MISDFYSETVILLDASTSTGGYWSTSTGPDYSTGDAIAAAINQAQGSERFFADGLTVRAEYKMYTDPSTEIYYGRRVRWEGDDYYITESPKNTLQKNHHFRVLLKAVDGA
jgi:hypothetical protein